MQILRRHGHGAGWSFGVLIRSRLKPLLLQGTQLGSQRVGIDGKEEAQGWGHGKSGSKGRWALLCP